MVYLKSMLVDAVEALGDGAVGIVPPIADQDFLVENGSFGAQKAVLPPVEVTIMVDLKKKGKL